MKTVYTSDMVAHLWANGHTEYARVAGRNFYTENGELYSYGPHFMIGAFAHGVLLWNNASYSNTTAKHKHTAYHALTSAQRAIVVTVPSLKRRYKLADLAADCVKAAREPLEKSDKARQNRDWLIQKARDWLADAAKLYTLAKKKAALPSIPADADKAQIKGILKSLFAIEYLKDADERASRAAGYLKDAEYSVSCVQPRSACKFAAEAIDQGERAQYLRKQAGKPASRAVAALLKAAKTLAEQNRAAADAAEREEIRQDVIGAARMLAECKGRGRDRGHYASRLREGLQGAEQSQRDEFAPLVAAAERMSFAQSLASMVQQLRGEVESFKDADQAGARYNNPPNGSRIAYAIERAKAAGAKVAYFERVGLALAADAKTLADAYAAREVERNAAAVDAWRNGERVSLPHSVPTMGRIVGETVETSRGATVPLDHAQRLVRIVRRTMERGGAVFAPGEGPSVGHFRVNLVESSGRIVIGCHEFGEPETSRLMALIEASETVKA